ncbi:O-methyltransferase [Streptacidiphilus rugosus]|uniref:O-methyltransferase n=1 Tax=Streptacidiphilus rugosus TaxID=405783 RepID=UPI00056C381C|nr:class I SAM-dependent methyltransferase [Streptacidiphilus rugosus]
MAEPKGPPLTPELYDYVLSHNPSLHPVQQHLVEATRSRFPEVPRLQIAPEQAPFLAFLVRLTGARRIVEVGTFTGLSALSMALAMPEDGKLTACDISREWTDVAREAWAEAGVAKKIDLRLAPAVETLRSLPDEPWIDMSFIDADKISYPVYWEEIVRRTRPGGLIAIDNTLYSGEVVNSWAVGDAAAIQAFNDIVRSDARVDAVLLTVADGMTLAFRRP